MVQPRIDVQAETDAGLGGRDVLLVSLTCSMVELAGA